MLLRSVKPDNLRRLVLAHGLEDAPAVFLHDWLRRVVGQPLINQRRLNLCVAKCVLDPVQIDPALCEPASDRAARIMQPDILDAGSRPYPAPGLVDVDEMVSPVRVRPGEPFGTRG